VPPFSQFHLSNFWVSLKRFPSEITGSTPSLGSISPSGIQPSFFPKKSTPNHWRISVRAEALEAHLPFSSTRLRGSRRDVTVRPCGRVSAARNGIYSAARASEPAKPSTTSAPVKSRSSS
jgi:hypothetical protein